MNRRGFLKAAPFAPAAMAATARAGDSVVAYSASGVQCGKCLYVMAHEWDEETRTAHAICRNSHCTDYQMRMLSPTVELRRA